MCAFCVETQRASLRICGYIFARIQFFANTKNIVKRIDRKIFNHSNDRWNFVWVPADVCIILISNIFTPLWTLRIECDIRYEFFNESSRYKFEYTYIKVFAVHYAKIKITYRPSNLTHVNTLSWDYPFKIQH